LRGGAADRGLPTHLPNRVRHDGVESVRVAAPRLAARFSAFCRPATPLDESTKDVLIRIDFSIQT
jgi:hypothetical protein